MELKAMGSEKRHIAGKQLAWYFVSEVRSKRTENCELADGKGLGVIFEGDHG
jgi:hypothetical protein